MKLFFYCLLFIMSRGLFAQGVSIGKRSFHKPDNSKLSHITSAFNLNTPCCCIHYPFALNGTNFSDGRYKKNVRDGVKGLDFILKLRPVTYQLDIANLDKKLNEGVVDIAAQTAMIDGGKIIQTGFVAQEVEQAAREVNYDFSGVDKPKNENDFYGLRYAEFVVPLVKAVQEQQIVIEKQQQQINDLKKDIEEIKRYNISREAQVAELINKVIGLELSQAGRK